MNWTEKLTFMFFMHNFIHMINTWLDIIPCDKFISFCTSFSFQLHQTINVSVRKQNPNPLSITWQQAAQGAHNPAHKVGEVTWGLKLKMEREMLVCVKDVSTNVKQVQINKIAIQKKALKHWIGLQGKENGRGAGVSTSDNLMGLQHGFNVKSMRKHWETAREPDQ